MIKNHLADSSFLSRILFTYLY